MVIKTDNVVFVYKDSGEELEGDVSAALGGVTAQIAQGEFVAVLGHNGSGKSTLAKLLNALLVPTEGTVLVGGFDTKNEADVWEIRKRMGMVFQNPDHQIVATIVADDVAFGPENLGVEQPEIVRRVAESLAAVGMLDYIDAAPHRLSGGQKQRVAIAGVLAMRTDCVILDESTSMLDPSGRKEVMDTVTRLNKEMGITVILITHYMDEAVKADRVIVMDGGKIGLCGTPKQVFKNIDKLKSIGLDVPQVAETAYLLKQKGLDLPDALLTIDELVDELCLLR